ncbi:hypothetical protein Tco_0419159, partial [Tanacetum coccineum]
NRTCTIKGRGKVKIQLHDGSSFILEDVRYVPGLRRSLISLGTLEKEGYTVKMQMGKIKVIKGCRVMMTGIRKKNCVYTLEAKVMTFGVQNHGVGFKQLGPGVETGVHEVQDEKHVWFEVELQGAQGDRKAEEQEKVHLGIKVGENITVTGVPGQESAEGNVAEKKKVKESMKVNLGKLLKYKAWLTRRSPVRARVLMEALEEFKDVSGLVPSIPKSTIFMCNVLEHGKAEIQQLMPFERGSLPIKYLGVSVISLRLLYKDSKVLVERGKAKVSWDDICLPKQEGGLGIRKLGMNNRIHGKVSRQPDQVANIVVDMVRLKLAVIRFKKNIHVDQMRIIWKIASISSNEG